MGVGVAGLWRGGEGGEVGEGQWDEGRTPVGVSPAAASASACVFQVSYITYLGWWKRQWELYGRDGRLYSVPTLCVSAIASFFVFDIALWRVSAYPHARGALIGLRVAGDPADALRILRLLGVALWGFGCYVFVCHG